MVPKQSSCLRLDRWQGEPCTQLPNFNRTLDGITEELKPTLLALIAGELPWPLFLYGSVGAGKTGAALALCDYALGTYWGLADLVDERHRDFNRHRVERVSSDIWDRWQRWPLAVLDEIGVRSTVRPTEYDTLKKAVDLRLNKPIIVISNIGPDDLVRLYDDRVVSRICTGTIRKLVGPDRRRNRNQCTA